MGREQEKQQFLGVIGICKEAYKIIFSGKKIFSQVTLSLILPLSIILLVYIQISDLFTTKIFQTQMALYLTPQDSPNYHQISDHMSTERTDFSLFTAMYLLFLFIFFHFSAPAVIYMVACIYTGKEVTIKKIISVVQKVWKRLMVTSLWYFIIMLGYNIVVFVVSVLCVFIWFFTIGASRGGNEAGSGTWVGVVVFGILLALLYMIGFVYGSIIYSLANVISVLEDMYGIQAMIKGYRLIKGKTLVVFAIYFMLALSYMVVHLVNKRFVLHGETLGMGMGIRVGFGILCFLLYFALISFNYVTQIVIYFVCKSYHQENVDKYCLADHLEVSLGEYSPVEAKDVQLEQCYV